MKLPAFQFYTGDYLKATRHLSLMARGAWVDLLCVMSISSERGEAVFSGKPQFGRFLGCSTTDVESILEELLDNQNPTMQPTCDFVDLGGGPFKLVSRRMKRDEEIRRVRQNAGKLGGNPNLVKQNPTTNLNQKATPSSSSSSSISSTHTTDGMASVVNLDKDSDPESEKRSNAQKFASDWLQANRPELSRKFRSFTDLILLVGKNNAISEVTPFLGDPKIRDPFNYVIGKIQSESNTNRPSPAPSGRSIQERSKTRIYGEV